MTEITLLLLLLALPVLAGIFLVRRGLRGRLIGDHPVCRRCGFDLFGLPDDQNRCPECGSDVRAASAVQTGHRRRRMGMVYTGFALLLLAGLIVIGAGGGVLRDVDWQAAKPAAWLAREARNGDVAAWNELSRRTRNGWISADRAQSLVTHALALQKDLAKTWLPAAGDFIETARSTKLVTDADWQTYARQAPQLSLRWRAKVRQGDDSLPGRVSFGPSRAGTMGKLSVRINTPCDTNEPLVIPPRQGGGGGYSQQSLAGGGGGSSSVNLRLDPKQVQTAPLGKRTTTIQLSAEVREQWDANVPVIEWTQDLTADWELVGPDVQTVEVVPDDSSEMRRQIEKGIVVARLDVQRPLNGRDEGRQISLNLIIAALPLPLAHDVFLRSADREWRLTSISVSGATHYGTGGDIPAKDNFDATRVDVIFRPSPGAAHHSVDITRMWNGEIVIPDVVVNWPATQPTTSKT